MNSNPVFWLHRIVTRTPKKQGSYITRRHIHSAWITVGHVKKRVSQTPLKQLNWKRKGAQIPKGKLRTVPNTEERTGHSDNIEQTLIGLPFSIPSPLLSTRRHLSNANLIGSIPPSHWLELGNLRNPTAMFLKRLQEASTLMAGRWEQQHF